MTTPTVRLTVDGATRLGPLRRVWSSIGYDELNWTYTPRGKLIYQTLGSDVFTAGPYDVRMHNAFTSGNGLSGPAWGAGNPYHQMPDASVRYDWSILDRAYDTITGNGGVPLIELGFMPRDLSRSGAKTAAFLAGQDVGREPYESGDWKEPPADLNHWSELVHNFVRHLVERYGADAVKTWHFEVWNEPDIPNYWRGTFEEYAALYDASVRGAKSALPEARVGGPATTGHGEAFLERFLDLLQTTGQSADFLSFHTKGAYYYPRRLYNPFIEPPRQTASFDVMMDDIRRSLAVIQRFPTFAGRPIFVDECDPAVGTIYGVYDNPNFVVTNSEYYASFVARLVGAVLDLPAITRITHWAFYMEGKRWFEGNRTLVDNENVEKPIMNGLRLLERLAGGERLAVHSDDALVGGVASARDTGQRLLVWRHHDDWWVDDHAEVSLRWTGFDPGRSGVTARIVRLDRDHANTYRAWQALGAPDDPTPAQVQSLRSQGQLQTESLPVVASDGALEMRFTVPMHGLALITLEPS